MARKQENTKESIIAASIDFIEKNGYESFSVRNVANHIQISTQPIYSYFTNIVDLHSAVLLEIEKQLLVQINFPYSDFVFRNMGIGFTLYAKYHPNLFNAFFSPNKINEKFITLFLQKLRNALDMDERLMHISIDGKDQLLEKMWTFSFGYATLLTRGFVKNCTDDTIKQMILDTGTAIILATLKHEEGK